MATNIAMTNPDELRRLYLDERMTTKALGEHYGVSSMSIKRWLYAFEIPRRPSNNGLMARGIVPPTGAELRAMIYDQHMTYAAIANVFGVDHTAVSYWLTSLGIPKPSLWQTRHKGRVVTVPSAEDLRRFYESGESIVAIANRLRVPKKTLRGAFTEYGIEVSPDGWQGGRRWTCTDGHLVRSSYEQRVDDWLHEHSLQHELEPQLPFDRRYRSDFLVGQTYIEVWGVINSASYDERKRRKRALYRVNNLPLIELAHWNFRHPTWIKRLSALL